MEFNLHSGGKVYIDEEHGIITVDDYKVITFRPNNEKLINFQRWGDGELFFIGIKGHKFQQICCGTCEAIYENKQIFNIGDSHYFMEPTFGYFDDRYKKIIGKSADYGDKNGKVIPIYRADKIKDGLYVILAKHNIEYLLEEECSLVNDVLFISGKESILLLIDDDNVQLTVLGGRIVNTWPMDEFKIDCEKYHNDVVPDIDYYEHMISSPQFPDLILSFYGGQYNQIFLKNKNPILQTKPAI